MTELLPCPFCNERLLRTDSVARALDQEKGGRPVWEYHHPRGGCVLSSKAWYFDPVTAPDDAFCAAWNTRPSPSPADVEAVAALTQIADDCASAINLYERNGPSFTSPGGDEYEPASYVQTKLAELRNIARAAIAAMSARPSTCPHCNGSGNLSVPLKQDKSGWGVCGHCGGMGVTPARPDDERAAVVDSDLVERVRPDIEALVSVGAIDPRDLIQNLRNRHEIADVIEGLQRAIERGAITFDHEGMIVAPKEFPNGHR